jgi:hypothetical protein
MELAEVIGAALVTLPTPEMLIKPPCAAPFSRTFPARELIWS